LPSSFQVCAFAVGVPAVNVKPLGRPAVKLPDPTRYSTDLVNDEPLLSMS
jgi:hypothetical protein